MMQILQRGYCAMNMTFIVDKAVNHHHHHHHCECKLGEFSLNNQLPCLCSVQQKQHQLLKCTLIIYLNPRRVYTWGLFDQQFTAHFHQQSQVSVNIALCMDDVVTMVTQCWISTDITAHHVVVAMVT